jgi:hypothetical protein
MRGHDVCPDCGTMLGAAGVWRTWLLRLFGPLRRGNENRRLNVLRRNMEWVAEVYSAPTVAEILTRYDSANE